MPRALIQLVKLKNKNPKNFIMGHRVGSVGKIPTL